MNTPAQRHELSKVDLAGRWSLVSWAQVYDDGRLTYPMGQNATGFIHYGARHMSCLISRRGRTHFVTGGQWNADMPEKAGAYDSFMSYCGTYEIEMDTIIHYVAASLYPNWEGGEQRRRAQLDDGRLVLTARLEEGTPQARTATLEWERADD
jgi:hypothetical protein